jgi:hypothetical protein
MAQTIIINNQMYNVERIIEIDATQFPTRARNNKADWYLSVAGGRVMYTAIQRHDGTFSKVMNTGQSLASFKNA